MIVNVPMEMDIASAFKILCDVAMVKIDEDNIPKFSVNESGDIVCDVDDRGELYLAMYHLATKLFMNTSFRHKFDNPNDLMSDLYWESEQIKEEDISIND